MLHCMPINRNASMFYVHSFSAIQMGRPSKFRGHSLYNSNLPFPNKVSRTDANGSVADGTNNVPISLGMFFMFYGGGVYLNHLVRPSIEEILFNQ